MSDLIPSHDRLLKVARTSPPPTLAGAICKQIRHRGYAVAQAMGASATNQMVKAIVIARSYLAEEGLDLLCTATTIPLGQFDETGEEVMAIRMEIRPVPLDTSPGMAVQGIPVREMAGRAMAEAVYSP